MLRKRSRPVQRDQAAAMAADSSPSRDPAAHKARASRFFTVAGLFVGFASKAARDAADCTKSPTSPLDSARSPRSPASWDCDRVGLSLVEVDPLNTECRSILMRVPSLKAQLRLDASASASSSSSLSPKSSSSPIPVEIELSEEYTCIISHGPNPKTTHIFGDCILDGDSVRCLECRINKSASADADAALAVDDCNKQLEQGDHESSSEEEGDKPAARDDSSSSEIFEESASSS